MGMFNKKNADKVSQKPAQPSSKCSAPKPATKPVNVQTSNPGSGCCGGQNK